MHPEVVVHLEHDGKVLLVDEAGQGPRTPSQAVGTTHSLRFPTPEEVERMGIRWDAPSGHAVTHVEHQEETYHVLHGRPELEWPSTWAWKDALPSQPCVHPVARESVYRSVHRVVAKLIVVDGEGQILMGEVERGHFIGSWTLPGGYVDHDEHPQAGALRELWEEFGLEVGADAMKRTPGTNEPWVHIQQRIFDERGVSFLSLTYGVELDRIQPATHPKPGEIARSAWFDPAEALRRTASQFDRAALKRFIGQR